MKRVKGEWVRPHRPNQFPLRARLAIGVFGGLFLQFACVAAANGLVHLPGKRGSVMLSGLPTLLIALASLSLFAASALYILDHHDRRPNEALYQAGRRFLGGLAFALFLAAPLLEHLAPAWARSLSWHLDWFDMRPGSFHALLSGYPPEWRPGPATVGALAACLVVPALITKWVPALASSRLLLGVMGLGMAGLGACWMLESLFDIASGHIGGSGRGAMASWSAADPARFQAIAATHVTLALLIWSTGLLLTLAACLRPLKTDAENPN